MSIMNEILAEIVVKTGGTVTNPSNRNQLLKDWLNAITPPVITYVYGGGFGGFALFDTVAPIASTNIAVSFAFYVSSHTGTIRGLVCNGDGFTAASSLRNVTVRIQANNNLAIQFRNAGGTNNTIEVPDVVPVGQWLIVTAQVTDGLQNINTSWSSPVIQNLDYAPAYTGTDIRILDISTADSVGVQIEKVSYIVGGVAQVDALCNEGAGLVSVNTGSLADGVINSESIHRVRA